jgi:hypothetical protein
MASFPLGKKANRPEGRRSSGDLVIEPGSRDDPPIGAEIHNPGIRWDLMFVLFLRFTSVVWLLKGIGFWALVMGLGDLPLTEESRLRQALIIGFALVDCAAAVGLWLISPWGKSLWVFVVVAEIALGVSGFGKAVGLTSASGSGLALFFFFVLAFAVRRRHLGAF